VEALPARGSRSQPLRKDATAGVQGQRQPLPFRSPAPCATANMSALAEPCATASSP